MGVLTEIQRFSIHDGPGIRTTVFLKGCPLRCQWCHNPETHSARPELAVTAARCAACGVCAAHCPNGAIRISPEGATIDRAACKACFSCVGVCPNRALRRYGAEYTAEQLTEILLKDRAYYDKTGGGVTFSGGEPLIQSGFVRETAELLRENGVHSMMETSCYAGREALEQTLPVIDRYMVDLKVKDDAAHRHYTGVSVEPILQNIAYLSEQGADVLIRIPIVTGCNDTAENMEATARFLNTETRFRKIELLRMHKLAEHKYASLDKEYLVSDLPIPEEERIAQLAEQLTTYGMTVLYGKTEFPAK